MINASEFFERFNANFAQLYGAEARLKEALGEVGSEIKVVPPFVCTNGTNTFLGDGVHINLETFFDDQGKIQLGNRVLTGPFLKILTRDPNNQRVQDVSIEDDVWIGGGVIIYPGVRVGRGSVISAGSVVRKDVPADSLVVGSPAKQLRVINQDEEPEGINSRSGLLERQKMVSQQVFYSSDPTLKKDKQKAYEFFRDFNLHQANLSQDEKRANLDTILGGVGKDINIQRFYFSYGYQVFIGDGVTIGDRVFLGDAGKITLGDQVVLEEEVQLYTTNHCLPIPYRGYIMASDITLGPRVRIGRRAIILPGVKIGEGATVKKESVVTKDVLPFTTVSGIPAKPVE